MYFFHSHGLGNTFIITRPLLLAGFGAVWSGLSPRKPCGLPVAAAHPFIIFLLEQRNHPSQLTYFSPGDFPPPVFFFLLPPPSLHPLALIHTLVNEPIPHKNAPIRARQPAPRHWVGGVSVHNIAQQGFILAVVLH